MQRINCSNPSTGKQMKKNGLLLATALTAVSVLMSACVVTPVDPYYDQSVRLPPPPPRHEYQGYPPAPDYVWMSGYWGWGGVRYEWMPGRWEAPRQGYYWVPHRWDRDGEHWRQSGGRWEQDHRPRAVPPTVVMPEAMPRRERENPQYRESGAYRDAQPRVEPRPAPPPERAGQPRYEQRDGARPAQVSPAYRPAPAVAPSAAPAPAPVQSQGAVRREEPGRGGDRGEGRGKRRNPDDERR